MYEVLRSHPDVCMAEGTKETLFFEEEYDRGVEWYEAFFSSCRDSQARGEISNTYIYDEQVPARMHEVVPNATLISCLRNPIERIQSVYLLYRRNGKMQMGFEEAIRNHPFLIEQNRYWSLLQNYIAYYGEEQIRVLFYDDLRDAPERFLEELCSAIGVDSERAGSELVGEQVNAGAKARHWTLGRIASWTADILRATGNHAVLDSVKRNSFLRSIVLKPLSKTEKQVIGEETRSKLLEEYECEFRGIERFTGRDLEGWRRGQ